MRLALVLIALYQVIYACEDGKGNVISVFDLLEETAKIRFINVTLGVYKANKKPLCFQSAPVLQMPGYVKFISGQVEILEPVKFKKEELRIQFTTEHSSFFIGQVCLNGESVNAFVPNSFCERDFCKVIGVEMCKLFNVKQVIDAHQLYADYFELPALSVSDVGGEWKAEAGLSIRGNEIARIRLGRKNDWIRVQLSEKGHEEL